MKNYDVIIVGGGAAGLACAAALSENPGIKILVAEAGDRAGKKLAATGNGQGNVFNVCREAGRYHGGNLAAVEKIAFPADKPSEWACERIFGALLYKYGAYGRAYPAGMQASSLADLVLKRLARRGVEVMLSARVANIRKSGCGFVADCGEKSFYSDYIVLAAGGKAQKQFKTDGSAYGLAENFGHFVTPLRPSIVQLKTDTSFIKNLRGVRAECKIEARSGGEVMRASGDVIFTDYGVSGNAVFSVSGAVCSGGELAIEFLPDIPAETLKEVINRRKADGIPADELLCGLLHNQLARAVLKRAASEDTDKIVGTVKNFTLEVKGALGFDYAQVTKGGVGMDLIKDNLESKIVENLYFAGEILDVDGDCGGYNLNWAFTSGIAVADDIAFKITGCKKNDG